jgi:hypothetical protein
MDPPSAPSRPAPGTRLPLLSHLSHPPKHPGDCPGLPSSLQQDLDSIISGLVPSSPSRHLKLALQQRALLAKKIQASSSKIGRATEWSSHPLLQRQVKSLKQEVGKHIARLRPEVAEGGDYAEFVKLSRESEDYLEFYLKSRFRKTEGEVLRCTGRE